MRKRRLISRIAGSVYFHILYYFEDKMSRVKETHSRAATPVEPLPEEACIQAGELLRFWKLCAEDCPSRFLTQLIEMAVRNDFPLKPLLKPLSLNELDSCAISLEAHTELPDLESLCHKLLPELTDSGYPLFAERLNQHVLGRQLTQGLLEPSRLLTLLDKYCRSAISDARMIYRDGLLRKPDSYILPAQYKFALCIREVLQLMENEDYAGCIPLLKKALHLYPQLSVAVSGLTKYLKEQLKNPPRPTSPEFEILGAQVKQVLHGLMENRQWEEAYAELTTCVFASG